MHATKLKHWTCGRKPRHIKLEVLHQDVDELLELLLRVGPNPEDVIQTMQIDEWSPGTFGEDGALPLCSRIRQHLHGKLLPHGRSVDLQVGVPVEVEIIHMDPGKTLTFCGPPQGPVLY